MQPEHPVTKPGSGVALAGTAGIVSIGLALVALPFFPLWEYPATNAPGAQLASFIQGHAAGFTAAVLLDALAVCLWMVFGSGVWLRLRSIVGGDTVLTTTFAFCVVAYVGLLLTGFTAALVVAYRTPGAEEARLLSDLCFGALAMSGIPTAIALSAFAAIVFRHGGFPRLTAWFALDAAAAHLLLPFSFVFSTGFLSLEGQVVTVFPGLLFVWICATGIAMWRGEHATATRAVDAAVAF
jgi:hypothetical protein